MRTKRDPGILCPPNPRDVSSSDAALQQSETVFRQAVDKKLKGWKAVGAVSIEFPRELSDDAAQKEREQIVGDYRDRGGWKVTEIHNEFVHCLMFT
jgi:hypothetical protein